MYGSELVNTAFSLRLEEVSRLMEINANNQMSGYIFIKPTEAYAMKNLELDDIFRLGIPMTVRDTIRFSLIQEKQQQLLAQATEELITELRDNGKTFEIMTRNLTGQGLGW
jgi:hypothetical protein